MILPSRVCSGANVVRLFELFRRRKRPGSRRAAGRHGRDVTVVTVRKARVCDEGDCIQRCWKSRAVSSRSIFWRRLRLISGVALWSGGNHPIVAADLLITDRLAYRVA